MSARSNSFKLQRLSKTVGIRDHSISEFEPKEAVKLPALNSISLGVKYNDLSFVTGRDLNKLRKQPEVGDDLQYQSAHQNLSSIRKNYDNMHKQATSKEHSISKLKQDQNKLKIIQGQLLDNKQSGRKKVDNYSNKLNNIKLLYTEADMQKKVLLQMKNRLKHDKVVYDQRKFNMEKQLRFLKKQIDVIKIDKTQMSESDDRTMKLYRKLLAQLNQEQVQRENHLTSIQNMIDQKQRMNANNLNRSQQMQEIAERAMQDKDQTQKNWQKLYLTNKFVDRMLRNKMDKQMSKFFIVESAFKTIKIATGVNDAESLVKKFLNKEQTYGDLLGKIAENEKRIQQLKQQSQQLKHEWKQLEDQKQIIDSTKITKIQITQQMKKLQETQNSRQKANLNKQKIRAWLSRNTKKCNSILGTDQKLDEGRQINSIKQNFLSYIKMLSTHLEQINKQEKQVNQSFQPNQKIKNSIKLKRINEKNNSSTVDDESEDEGHLNHEQDDLISGQRQQVIKVNEKAMKQIKRKHQELRKVKMEQASPKKKEPQPPKKKPEDQ